MTTAFRSAPATLPAPSYATTLPGTDRPLPVGVDGYQELTDEWGLRMQVGRLSEIVVDNDIATGYAAMGRWIMADGRPGPSFKVPAGFYGRDNLEKFGFVGLELRNYVQGQNAKVIVEVYGV